MTPQPIAAFCSECGRPTAPDQLARFGDRLICPYCKDSYAQKLREGVAPMQAVSYAGFWIRFLAYLIDLVILIMLQSIVNFALFGAMFGAVPRSQITPGQDPFTVLAPMFAQLGSVMLSSTIITAAYYAGFIGALAATPGKLVLGLRIVRADGTKVSYLRALGRCFAQILSGIILYIGYIMIAFDSQKRSLHDMICDTRVIRVRA